jgi:hypothetical protein
MRDGATDTLKKRTGEGYHSSLTGRHLMDSEVKFREFFSFERLFQTINFSSNCSSRARYTHNKELIQKKTKHENSLLLQDYGVSRRSQGSDAAAAHRSGPCAVSQRATHARDF